MSMTEAIKSVKPKRAGEGGDPNIPSNLFIV